MCSSIFDVQLFSINQNNPNRYLIMNKKRKYTCVHNSPINGVIMNTEKIESKLKK